MKPKKIKKLALGKTTVANLENDAMDFLKGGGWGTHVRTCYSTDTSCDMTGGLCTCNTCFC